MADETVRVDLRRSVGLRRGLLYGPGKGIEIPVALARALGISGDSTGVPVHREPGPKEIGSTVEAKTTPSVSENLKTAEDVQAAFTVRDAERYLARITDAAEVKRLAGIDKRSSLKKVYRERLQELKG